MSVMLSFGLALGSLGYKQQVLASSAIVSQYAFYVADAALECALYADQQQNFFAYQPTDPSPALSLSCGGATTAPGYPLPPSRTASQWIITTRLSYDGGTRCADVIVYKPNGAGTTYLFSQGYDVSCSTVASPNGARFVSRGLNAHY
jgi:hypothetical protein